MGRALVDRGPGHLGVPAQRPRQGEVDVLGDHLDLAHLGRAATVSTPSSQAGSTADASGTRWLWQPWARATSTSRLELEELSAPMTRMSWHSRASALTAACRFWVA
jgi:hypothetical protein